MKTIPFFVLINLLIFHSSGENITDEKAQLAGKNFYYECLNRYQYTDFNSVQVIKTCIVRAENEVVYYVFNFRPKGFVVVAATDAVMPVLGYSFTGSYTEENQPDNFAGWMDHYKVQILYAIRNDLTGEYVIKNLWERMLTEDPGTLQPLKDQRNVEPMLNSTWNQGYPYNALCPEDPAGPNGRCYAGCVATAMGQVMYYYRWPDTGTGSYTYQHPEYGTISADFGSTTYKWDDMVNQTTMPNFAIAELLFHLGVSVDMDYGPDGSGMWNHKAAYSLRTYFKYSPKTQYVFRDSPSMDWDSLVVAHIDRFMPCYYAGWADYTYTSGHAFVVDGYQGDYFHMNWGWSGSFDGYFLLDNLTPGGSNFNYAQELIINCFPDTVNYVYPEYCTGTKTLTTKTGTFEDGSSPMYPYQNNTYCNWLISPQTQEDSISDITLTFNRFGTSQGDTVFVYDGNSENSVLLGAFSGDEIPGAVTSSGNQMLIAFHSNETDVNAGWFASYSTSTPEWCSGSTTQTYPAGQVGDGSGTFNYSNNSICQFRIMPAGASWVTLTFNTFATEEDADWVKVIDLGSQTVIGEFSGSTIPEPVTATSGKMLILFTTNGSVTAQGWDATYISDLVGIAGSYVPEDFLIYPNPAKDMVMFRFTQNNLQQASLEIMNLSGQIIRSIALTDQNDRAITIDVTNFTGGLYIVKLTTLNGTTIKKLFID